MRLWLLPQCEMGIVNCRLMGLASQPLLPPLDVKSVIISNVVMISEA